MSNWQSICAVLTKPGSCGNQEVTWRCDVSSTAAALGWLLHSGNCIILGLFIWEIIPEYDPVGFPPVMESSPNTLLAYSQFFSIYFHHHENVFEYSDKINHSRIYTHWDPYQMYLIGTPADCHSIVFFNIRFSVRNSTASQSGQKSCCKFVVLIFL